MCGKLSAGLVKRFRGTVVYHGNSKWGTEWQIEGRGNPAKARGVMWFSQWKPESVHIILGLGLLDAFYHVFRGERIFESTPSRVERRNRWAASGGQRRQGKTKKGDLRRRLFGGAGGCINEKKKKLWLIGGGLTKEKNWGGQYKDLGRHGSLSEEAFGGRISSLLRG